MVHQNSGQFAALSRRKLGSDSRMYYLKIWAVSSVGKILVLQARVRGSDPLRSTMGQQFSWKNASPALKRSRVRIPSVSTMPLQLSLVERRIEDPSVGGSTPPGGTNKLSIGITTGSVCHSDKVEIESSNLSLWTIGVIVQWLVHWLVTPGTRVQFPLIPLQIGT